MEAQPQRETAPQVRHPLVLTLLVLVAIYVPFNVEYEIWSEGRNKIFFHYFDFPLLGLMIVGIPIMVGRILKHRDLLSWLLAASCAWMVLATLVHPSLSGSVLVYRLLAWPVLIACALRLPPLSRERGIVRGVVVAMACFEAFVAIAQVVKDDVIGLSWLGESSSLYAFGATTTPEGTFDHPYRLAGFTLLGAGIALGWLLDRQPSFPKALVAAVLAVPLGLTFSRMALIGVVSLCVVLAVAAWKRRGMAVLLSIAFLASFTITAVVRSEGWIQRATISDSRDVSTSTRINTISSGRLELMRQAMELTEEEPIVGHGPRNYLRASVDRYGLEGEDHVHNVPLLASVEGGAPAGVLFALALVAAGLLAWRTGVTSILVYVSFLPFFVLEAFPYVTSQGLAMTGLWFAGVAMAADDETAKKRASEASTV
jgi:hypothetical protein